MKSNIGAPGTIRTSGPQIRSLVLYPAELRARNVSGRLGGILKHCNPVAVGMNSFYGFAMKKSPYACFAALLLVSGCADHSGAIPSLTPRPIEKIGKSMIDEPVGKPLVLKPSDPSRVEAVNALVSKARAAVAPFQQSVDQAMPVLRRAVGSPQGSENWVAAQVALGRVEINRAPVKSALSDLDAQRRVVLVSEPSDDQALVEAAVAEVEAMDKKQEQVLAAMIRMVDPR
jgi:hypothetical protein